jgi:hypothetical protein
MVLSLGCNCKRGSELKQHSVGKEGDRGCEPWEFVITHSRYRREQYCLGLSLNLHYKKVVERGWPLC